MNSHYFQNGHVTLEAVTEAVREADPYTNDLYKKTNDIDSSRLFADLFHDVLRFNTTAKEWFFYDGIVWRMDQGGMKAEALAKAFSKALYLYSADIEDELYRKYVNKLSDRNKRKTIIEDSRDYYCISNEMLDRDLSLFNCQNCVLKIDTYPFEVIDHSPDLLLSKVSNVSFSKDSHSPLWEEFINAIMCEDEEKTEYLQEISGYSMTGDRSQEELYILYGATTRNGKSTFLETLSHMFGDYSMNTQPETLAQRIKSDSKSASGDLARLVGCRLLRTSEPPKNMLFNESLVKGMIGGEKITARHMYERDFEYYPIFKLIMNTNYLPVVKDPTLFSSGRVKVITFDRHFSEEEQDLKLKEKLLTEDNMSGVLNWCLEGLRRYHENGDTLTVPECVRRSTEEYKSNSDKIKLFFEDRLSKDEDSTLKGGDVYKIYKDWCDGFGYCSENKGNFFDELRRRGIMSDSGTVNGRTERNVVKGYARKEDTSEGLPGDPFGEDGEPFSVVV